MDVLVGLDAGTTATKAVTAGAAAVVRDVVSIGYPLLVPSPGWAELDAPRLVRAAVEALTEVVRAAQERGDRVVGLSLSAAMHGLVPMTSEGTPLAPLATWADSRASAQAAALRADGRAQGLHARTGTPRPPDVPDGEAGLVVRARPGAPAHDRAVGRRQGAAPRRPVRAQ
jgi:gluconokinase